jgi:hypothetical protein
MEEFQFGLIWNEVPFPVTRTENTRVPAIAFVALVAHDRVADKGVQTIYGNDGYVRTPIPTAILPARPGQEEYFGIAVTTGFRRFNPDTD